MTAQPAPRQGEIWFIQFPTDPPGKGRRPVVIVSTDGRNCHERASTVLVIPLSTGIHRMAPTHILLKAGETGLGEDSVARPESVTEVWKQDLAPPRGVTRTLSHTRICELAARVTLAFGCL